jgi:hypothetical protein
LGIDIEHGMYEYHVLKGTWGDQPGLTSVLERVSRGGALRAGTDTKRSVHRWDLWAGWGVSVVCDRGMKLRASG